MNNVKRFEELEVWKESRSLSKDIYNQFKSRERFADRPLAVQIIRSSGSVTDNIAEGFERGGNKEFLQYLWISKASAGECRSQLYRAFDSELLSQEEFDNFKSRVELLSVKLYRLIQQLRDSDFKGQKYK
jgi:four helix bundle protein